MNESQGQPIEQAGARQRDEARRHVSVGLDARLEARLDAYVADTGKSRSVAVRDLVESGLVELLGRGLDAAPRGDAREGDASRGTPAR